jgi:hypothetical protein
VTPFMRWLRRWREKYLGTWFEGPEPPVRLAEMVAIFANGVPNATRSDWMQFAIEHAYEAYRSGYQRGYEHIERDPLTVSPTPDELADAIDPDWRICSDPIWLEEPYRVPPTQEPTEEETLRDLIARFRE